jgi:hypothetical protein
LRRHLESKRDRRRRGLKLAAYVGLGIVSAGILAAVLAIALRRKHGASDEAVTFGDDEIVGEVVTAPEPVPAT